MQALNRGGGKSGKKNWIRAIILIVAWVLIFSLAKDLFKVKRGYVRIEEAQSRLALEEEKNQELKNKLDEVMTGEYKERIIREQLNMQKVGEVVAVLPKNEGKNATTKAVEESPTENWRKWWALLNFSI